MPRFPVLQAVADVTKDLLLPHVWPFVISQLTMSPSKALLDEKERIIRASDSQAP